jgi:hypothetical protein
MNSKKEQIQFAHLVLLSLQGNISEEQGQVLMEILDRDPEALSLYVDLMEIYTELSPMGNVRIPSVSEPQLESQVKSLNDLLNILASEEEIAPIVNVPKPVEPKPTSDPEDKPVQVRKAGKFNLWAICLSTAALLFIIAYPQIKSFFETVSVATITDCLNCQWGENKHELKKGDIVLTKPRKLLSGFVALTFDYGAEVLVEGPAEFTPLSAEKMILHCGKVYAHVPKQAIGFTIVAPDSSVVDMGTDFGVEILTDGSNETHVYEGKVNLIAGSGNQSKASEIVTKNQARKIDSGTTVIKPTEFNEFLFAQKISSKENRVVYGRPVSLASLVAGGDGRIPGNQLTGIDPATGQIHQIAEQRIGRTGSGTYSAVAERAFIDGVFVPNGPSKVSSAGHIFEGFPATTNSFWSDITASPIFNYLGTNENGEVIYRQQFIATLETATEEKADSEKSVILMHPNSGITFDLNNIRNAFKNAEIVGFRATCGISKNAMAKMKHDFWVLLDGQQVFHYSQPVGDDTAQTIYIPVHPEQSYLTLATTDGGDNISYDWCLYENAVLELAPKGLQLRGCSRLFLIQSPNKYFVNISS